MTNYSSPFGQLFNHATQSVNYGEDYLRGQQMGLQNQALRQEMQQQQMEQQQATQSKAQLGQLLQNYNPKDFQTLALIAKNDPKLAETLSKINGDYADTAFRQKQTALVGDQQQTERLKAMALRQKQLSAFLNNASNYLASAPESQKATIYNSLLKDAEKNGLPISGFFKGGYTPDKADLLQKLSVNYNGGGEMNPQQKAYQTTMSHENAKQVQKIPQEIASLEQSRTLLNELEGQLDNIGPTGPLLLGNKYLGYVAPGAKQADRESFATNTNQLVLKMAQELKGSLSDKDREFLQKSTLGLSNTKEGNRKIINTLRNAAGREIQRKQLFADYVEANDGSSAGFDKYLKQALDSNQGNKNAIQNSNLTSDQARKLDELRRAGIIK